MTKLDLAPKIVPDEDHHPSLSWRSLVCVMATIVSVLALPWVPYSPIVGAVAVAVVTVAFHRDIMWRLALLGCIILLCVHGVLAWESLGH